MIVKMIQDLRKRMEAKIEKMQEMFKKDLENIKNQNRAKEYNHCNKKHTRRNQQQIR